MCYIYIVEYYSAMKSRSTGASYNMDELQKHYAKWMQKTIYYMILFLGNSNEGTPIVIESGRPAIALG